MSDNSSSGPPASKSTEGSDTRGWEDVIIKSSFSSSSSLQSSRTMEDGNEDKIVTESSGEEDFLRCANCNHVVKNSLTMEMQRFIDETSLTIFKLLSNRNSLTAQLDKMTSIVEELSSDNEELESGRVKN